MNALTRWHRITTECFSHANGDRSFENATSQKLAPIRCSFDSDSACIFSGGNCGPYHHRERGLRRYTMGGTNCRIRSLILDFHTFDFPSTGRRISLISGSDAM